LNGALFYAVRAVLRDPRRTLSVTAALALAVGLTTATVLYVTASSRALTDAALRPVAADLVVHGTTDRLNAGAVAADYRTQPGVKSAEPLVAADLTSLARADGTKTTGSGRIFATTPGFIRTFPFVATTDGAFGERGVLITPSTASQLGVSTGDSIVVATASGRATFPVSGVLDPAAVEPLFSSGDPNFEGDFTIVPDVIVMPLGLYQQSPVALTPGTLQGKAPLDPQVYVQIDRSQFASSPATAHNDVRNFAFGLERRFTGQVKVTNNDESALNRAKKDVIGAEVLFIFLGIPGVAVAGFLAFGATQVFREESRREIGLLRARGASPRQITLAAAFNALFVGALGSVAGLLAGWAVASAVGGAGTVVVADVLNTAPIAVAAGVVLTAMALLVPVILSLRNEITAERRRIVRSGSAPVWQRYWLDAVALGLAAAFFLITYLTGGFKPANAEGQSISLAFYVFLGPLFLWVGLTLSMQRVVGRQLPRLLALAARALRLGGFGSVATKDLIRRPAIATTTTTIVALTVAFALSVIAFTATYQQERSRDGQYVVGSDIRVTVSSAGSVPAGGIESALNQAGVTKVSGFLRETNALIGAQRQTVYAIDVATFRQTAFLPDSFFQNGNAAGTLDSLANTPNGVLVSRDEVLKFNIQLGDPLIVRIPTTPGGTVFTELNLHVVGFVKYFPTSSQDSDFIINRSAMAAARPSLRNDVYLVKTSLPESQLGPVSAAIRAAVPPGAVARVEDLGTAAKVDTSSLTSLNVTGLGSIERWFSYAFAAGALLIFVFTLMAERRKEYSSMRALGASLGQVRRMLAVQAASVTAIGMVVGLAVGMVMAYTLVKLLGIIFIIPASTAAFVSGGTWLLLGGAAFSAVAAVAVASQALGRSRIAAVLREE
jgi:putative ABC transport system permease protein